MSKLPSKALNVPESLDRTLRALWNSSMVHWAIVAENPRLYGTQIPGRGRGTGCLLVFIGFFAAFFATFGSVLLVFAEDLFLKGGGALALVIGGVGLYTAWFNWHRDYRESILFDNAAGMLRLQSAATGPAPFEVPYGLVQRIHIHKQQGRSSAGSSGSRRHTFYILALVLHDGSELYLDAATALPQVKQVADELAAFTGFALDSHPEIGQKRAASRAAEIPLPAWPAPQQRPEFVRESHGSEVGHELRVEPARLTPVSRAISGLVLLAFFAAPLLIFAQPLQKATGGELAPGDVIFLVFGGLFSLAFYAILALVILLQRREFRVFSGSDAITVRLTFRAPFPSAWDREIRIPLDAIRGVEINRSEDGHYWLALGIDANFPIPMVQEFLANAGTFARHSRTGGIDDRQRLSLWEISAHHAGRHAPAVHDLAYIAQVLRRRLRGKFND